MSKRSSKIKLGRTKSHTGALLKNQLRSIFQSGYIVTTTAKAKILKKKLEILLNRIKDDSLENNRYMHQMLGKKELVQIARTYVKKTDSKVTIVKFSFRSGDSAQTSKVTLIGYEELFGKKDKKAKSGKSVDENKKDKEKKKEDESRTGEKQDLMEKKDEVDKGFMDKLNTNLKGKFVKKERARSRSGL